MALFGGVGVFWGPVIGAAVLVPLAETLNAELGTMFRASRAWSMASPSSSSCCWRRKASTGGSAIFSHRRAPRPNQRRQGGRVRCYSSKTMNAAVATMPPQNAGRIVGHRRRPATASTA